ncbi:hypothetical protein DFH07DRAFT_74289 [Mycena maculata]|uniref:Uncharacterized protein n=1 Tax=Mycena maculata TaxID=230809 RepID=A0AAD7K0W5_9AGAR|nr:hypothetical protein DFH07DRAFT_74289 [Mycena maculata]
MGCAGGRRGGGRCPRHLPLREILRVLLVLVLGMWRGSPLYRAKQVATPSRHTFPLCGHRIAKTLRPNAGSSRSGISQSRTQRRRGGRRWRWCWVLRQLRCCATFLPIRRLTPSPSPSSSLPCLRLFPSLPPLYLHPTEYAYKYDPFIHSIRAQASVSVVVLLLTAVHVDNPVYKYTMYNALQMLCAVQDAYVDASGTGRERRGVRYTMRIRMEVRAVVCVRGCIYVRMRIIRRMDMKGRRRDGSYKIQTSRKWPYSDLISQGGFQEKR